MLLRPTLAATSLLLLASAGLAASVPNPANYDYGYGYGYDHDYPEEPAKEQNMEPRAPLGPVTAAVALIGAVIAGQVVAMSVAALNVHSSHLRENYTQDVVANMRERRPDVNWVVVFDKIEHTTNFKGERGPDWDSIHVTVPTPIRSPRLAYTLYAFKAGEFTLIGDGGFQNWAYAGNFTLVDEGGKHVVFIDPTPSEPSSTTSL